MKTIALTVPEKRCTDEWWVRVEPETVADVLELVGRLTTPNADSDTERRIHDLQQRLEGANAAAQSAASAVSERLDEQWTRRFAEKDEMVAFVQAQCEQLKKMVDQAQQANETQKHHADAIIASLREQMEAKGAAAAPCTIAQLGGIAESEVEQLIVDTLACEVEDTSRNTGQGDRLVTTPEGLKLMVEVKNAERLHSKHDTEKFKRDVFDGIETQRINAAILLSLKSASIPNVGGACSIQFMQGKMGRVPVVMLASNSRTTIQLAMHAIKEMQTIAEREMAACGGDSIPFRLETLEKEREALMKTLPSLISFVHECDVSCDARVEMLQRLLHDAESERSRQKEMSYHLLRLQQSVPWLAAGDGVDEDVAVGIVRRFFERKGKYPKTSEMTQPQRTAIKNAGGLTHVIQLAKRKRPSDGDDEPTEDAGAA